MRLVTIDFGPAFARVAAHMGGNHQELEVVWREKWHKAKLDLELARLHFIEIEKGGNAIREEVYHRSLQALTAAAADYARVLQIYTDLKVRGRIPTGDPA